MIDIGYGLKDIWDGITDFLTIETGLGWMGEPILLHQVLGLVLIVIGAGVFLAVYPGRFDFGLDDEGILLPISWGVAVIGVILMAANFSQAATIPLK